jgi:hypothetical protein
MAKKGDFSGGFDLSYFAGLAAKLFTEALGKVGH